MAYDRWGVLKIKGAEPETFWIVFFDSELSHGGPFMQTSNNLDEKGVREWISKNAPTADPDEMIAKARANPR